MSAEYEALLIDVGNTRLKACAYNAGETISDVKTFETTDDLHPMLKHARKVFISCVGDKNKQALISKQCEEQDKPLFIARTQACSLGVHCAYENYATLGIDRWLAILAARSLTSLPMAVFDLGTAATCDVVVGDKHLGGWIAPGFELMRSALTSNTQLVFANSDVPEELRFADSTEECVNMGCLAAIQGLLVNTRRLLSGNYADYKILICGGNKQLLKELDGPEIEFTDNLVLKGLSLFV